MPCESGTANLSAADDDRVYLKRRVHDEAAAAARADSLAATLIHAALAAAYARRSCLAEDRAWVAQHRIW
jgi:hypothetical protein